MAESTGDLVSVRIIRNVQGTPAGKLADAEVTSKPMLVRSAD